MDLRELTLLSGVSGNEADIRRGITRELESLGVPYELDVLGNIIARKGSKGPKVMVDAHMDEVGLIVTFIEKNGFVRFSAVGGIDPRVLVSKRVLIGKDRVPGVIGAKAIHLQEPKEREQVIPKDQLFIDIGAKSRDEAEKKVKPGDYAIFDTEYEELWPGIIKSKALDDRVGCALLLETLKEPWENIQLYAVFAVQEEVGTRGARVASYAIAPDMGIALEGTVCADIPGTDKEFQATRLGKGAVLSIMDRGSIPSRTMLKELLRLAQENNIPVQFRETTSGGNDAAAIHLAREGCPVASISVPCRYIHTPCSVMSMADFEAAKKLLVLFLKSVEGGFRP
ncbi:MAG: M42 family metallopeptidase [Candidatus Fermentithermobacillus carboniphilus]|uniref:M42 family metallopeptidase n=1 Tax=Candidatus Fermentithermobacillus carboniphilus TaxID=3085328 RepID=A0AAT9LCS0_9FIRM|nr:MAG: M42 family metallopeptidase [Candidatus Fermentithermobacillus carboniphilus]